MEYSTFEEGGKKVSRFIVGTMNIINKDDNEEDFKRLDDALELGINVIDTAMGYGRGTTEMALGKYFESRKNRDEVFLISKCCHPSPWRTRVTTFDMEADLNDALVKMKTDYIEHLLSTVDCDMRGLRVLVDCANGAASATAPALFGKLPLHADFIFDKPDGININNGCGSTHMEPLCRGVVAGKYDLGIAFDGDADRCLLVDEKGNIIDGDKVLAVCGRSIKRKGGLNGNAIVATVMSNLGLHEFCRKGDYQLVCTDVGDRHVLEKMIECGYMIGGEQSGHTIFREFATTGDGELTALQFIQAYCEAGVPASELVSCCAQYPQELINVPVSAVGGAKQRIMADDRLWEQVRFQEELLHGDGRILVRPSGTEALIRVMVEAKTVETAHNVAQALADLIKTL